MTRTRDELYSQADCQPITDEHFLRRCSAPVEDVQEDDLDSVEEWIDVQQLLN